MEASPSATRDFPLPKKESSSLLFTLLLIGLSIFVAIVLFLAFSLQSKFGSAPKVSNHESTSSKATETPEDIQRKTDLRLIKKALEVYKKDQGVYPNSLADLSPYYLALIPLDPESKNGYDYRVSLDQNGFYLRTILSFGEEYTVQN